MGHGGMSCGMKTMRLVMVLFNIVFFLIGVALLALGIYLMVDPRFQKLKEFLPISSNPGVQSGLSYLEMMAIVVIVLGSVLLLIGFLGCCGAMKQVKCFLICYFIVVGLIILFEVAITIYFVAFQSKFRDEFVPKLQSTITNNYEGPLALINSSLPKPSPVSLAWDFVMYNLQCCGVENRSDFANAVKWNTGNPWYDSSRPANERNFTYPLTCCPLGGSVTQDWNQLPVSQLQNAATCAIYGTGTYPTGCYNKVIDVLNSAKLWVIIGAVLILIIELLAFIFAVALCCRKRKEPMYYSS